MKEQEIFPTVLVFDDFISNSDEMIDLTNKSVGKEWKNYNLVEDESKEDVLENYIKISEDFDIAPMYRNESCWFEIAQKIWNAGCTYAKKYEIGFSNMEHPIMVRYKKNTGFYKDHEDSGPYTPRIFSSILFLNDVDSGGEIIFSKLNVEIEPKKNRLIIFPSNYTFSYEEKTPTSNDKYIIVTYFNP